MLLTLGTVAAPQSASASHLCLSTASNPWLSADRRVGGSGGTDCYNQVKTIQLTVRIEARPCTGCGQYTFTSRTVQCYDCTGISTTLSASCIGLGSEQFRVNTTGRYQHLGTGAQPWLDVQTKVGNWVTHYCG